jgi:hypothetical protein
MTTCGLTQLLMNGYRKVAMRLSPWSHRVFIALGVLLLTTACQPADIAPSAGQAGVEFTFGIKEERSLKSASMRSLNLGNAAAVVVSIKDGTGTLVYNAKQIQLHNFAGNYQSAPLSLLPGTYALTRFEVVDGTGLTLYASPTEASDLAYLVEDPLDISFSVSKDAVTKVLPEVLSTEQRTPEDFGYANFGFEVVKVIDFLVAVFAYDETTQSLVMTTARIEVADGSSGQSLYTGNLQALTSKVSVPEGREQYRVTITKPSYVPEVRTFTGAELARYFKSTEEGPLEVVLVGGYPYQHSCKEILDAGFSTGSGMYPIDPDGASGAVAPLAVYCDMDTNGGGWTAVDPETAYRLGGQTIKALSAGQTTCQVNNDRKFEASYTYDNGLNSKIACQYDIDLRFEFSEVRVSLATTDVLAFISLAGSQGAVDIMNHINDKWGSLTLDYKGDIGIGTRNHPTPVLSLGRALGSEKSFGPGTSLKWPNNEMATTTRDNVLRLQYAESGSEGEGVRWAAGRIFVR